MNIFYLDFETGGLDATRNPIIQAAWIVERNREVIAERVFDVVPSQNDELNLGALAINGFTLERLKAGVTLDRVMTAMKIDCLPMMGAWICGHNVQFDINFLHEAGRRINTNIGMFLDTRKVLDTRSILSFYRSLGLVDVRDCKLSTACEYFGIEIQAHDALSDIRATRELFHHLNDVASKAFEGFRGFESLRKGSHAPAE